MNNKTMIFGTRAVIEAIRAGRQIEKIYIQSGLSNDLVKELIQLARQNQAPYTFTPQEKLNRLSSKNHQGVISILSPIDYATLDNVIANAYDAGREPFVLLLDRITDVRNFGAIARTAECAGLDGIVIADKGSALITADSVKTSAGALNHLPVCRSSDLKKTVQQLRESGIRVVACTEKASKLIYEIDLNSPIALVMGSEEDGISPDILRVADELVKIPMKGKVGSLNVSVAAGIAIYETIRQKL
ncbi:MAG: 23S rRNA (guanosine(2251)-2'-O)-methyltransferase RlmB [Bacteroidota bacterium]